MVHNPEHDQHTGILAWWAKNSVAANLLMLIALIGGVVGYFSMQRENNPAPFSGRVDLGRLAGRVAPGDRRTDHRAHRGSAE
jgi:hypothetical protein